MGFFIFMDQIDFFSTSKKNSDKIFAPLALRMSPKTLEEYFGQTQILAKGSLLWRMIEADRLNSVIFFGPPGSGKSALVRIIANKTKSAFEQMNAVTAGVDDIRKAIARARLRQADGKKTILLVDEIHHFNRSQQDALLPDVEKGTITLIGITTENPYFYVNQALISRSTVFEFKLLQKHDLEGILMHALSDKQNGFGALNINITDEAKEHLLSGCANDARRLLNALEIGVLSTLNANAQAAVFDLSVAKESIQKKPLLYDKSGDGHYDHISAFIKSMRGSNPDAALYWMAKMLSAGEDPRFIARRVVICSSEDVGNADPNALVVAISAFKAAEFLGMPEARIPLAQAVVYVATAPKSNAAYLAGEKAFEEVEKNPSRAVPIHLKDANLDGKKLGHGANYLYPHDYEGAFVAQEYWPDPKVLFEPTENGYEKEIKKRLEYWRAKSAVKKNNS